MEPHQATQCPSPIDLADRTCQTGTDGGELACAGGEQGEAVGTRGVTRPWIMALGPRPYSRHVERLRSIQAFMRH